MEGLRGKDSEKSQCIEVKDSDIKMEDVAISHSFLDGRLLPHKEKTLENKESMCCKVPVRVHLGVMAFLMFFITQMLRSNLYIARVDMMHIENNSTGQDQSSNKLEWSEQEIGVVLSAFYWSYWITELPGGLLAQRYGGCRVLGFSVLFAGLLNLIFPISCKIHYIAAAVLRALQGLALGVTWPATHALSAHWIPRTERSKFMTSYHGSALGTALTFPLGGLLMSVFNWESVFYVSGALTLIWYAGWWYLVYDTPSVHPHISYKEKKYLERTIGDSVISDRGKGPPLKIPWTAILLSGPFWAVLLASQGLMWGTITLSMQLPAYFKNVFKMNIKMNGLVSGIPEFCKFAFSITFSTMMDYMLRKEYLSITSVRKISVATCEFLPAAFLLILSFITKGSATIAVLLLASTSAVGGASSSGTLPNIVDLSPNFAGTLLGIIKTLTFLPGVLSPNMASLLNNEYGPEDSWYYIFLIMAVIYLFCGVIYMIYGSGEVQPWNQPELKENPLIVNAVMKRDNCNEDISQLHN